MHPLSDKDLDRLSREAAEQYDVEQNTSGWDKLEQKLNKDLPAKGIKERRRFLFFIWIFAVLCGGGLLWILTSDHTPQALTLKEGFTKVSEVPGESGNIGQSSDIKTSKQPGSEDQNKNRHDQEASVPEQKELKTEQKNPTGEKKRVAEHDQSTILNKPSNDKPSNRPVLNHEEGARQSRFSQLRRSRRVSERSNDKISSGVSPVQTVDKKEDHLNKDNTPASPLNEANAARENRSAPRYTPNAQQQDSSVAGNLIKTIPETVKTTADSGTTVKKASIPKGKSGFEKGLVISAVAAPDMSNVKFTNTDKVGYNFGVQLNYRMSQRWSVNTGVIYTKKNYTSRGKDFNPPKGSWIDNVHLNRVEGNCEMFDIPVNLRFDLNKSRNHRYFLSAGLSTYLMRKEEYHYHYQYTNGNPGYRHRTYPSDEHHWLSILNVSAGFEKKLSKRLSIQGEPYLKIPLAGVGYGNLKLNSYGVYFSLRYNTGLLSGRK